MTEQPDSEIGAKLREPFSAAEVEWRLGRSGVKNGRPWANALAYLRLGAIEDRLDKLFGVFGWRRGHVPGPGGGVMCILRVRDDAGEWVAKEDGAKNTDFEPIKGGLTDAFKRSARVWGIGRYLRDLGESRVTFVPRSDTANYSKIDGTDYWWSDPTLPEWALPAGERPKRPVAVADGDNAAFYAKLLDRAQTLNTLDSCDTALRYVGECLSDLKITQDQADNVCGVIRARREILPKPEAQPA